MTAQYKRWEGATGDYSLASNWAPISVRTALYSWTASGSGTNEYYLRTSGSADPGISAPAAVYINGTSATEGTAGSLAAGTWDYADNDTLGYSTIYVRLSGGGDPDAQALDYITFTQIPVATDHVRIPPGYAAISSGLDQSAIVLGSFVVEEGVTAAIASASAPLRIAASRFEFFSTGIAYIDLGATTVSPIIKGTATPDTGKRGLYLTGTALTTLSVAGGYVGLACRGGELATVTAARVTEGGGDLVLGVGCTLTTLSVAGGKCDLRCAATTVNLAGGTLTTSEAGTITTANVTGGTANLNSTGTITTLNLTGGNVDMLGCQVARTITTLNHNPRLGSADITYDPAVVTVTTAAAPDGPCRQTRVTP